MSYKGESWTKKIARAWLWEATINPSSAPKDSYVVLASTECGDVNLLRTAGVPASNIVAVDTDIKAIKACKQKYPEVEAIQGDVGDVVSGLDYSPSVAMLDFCGSLSPVTIKATLRVASKLKVGSRLVIVTMRGRESDTATATMIRNHYRVPKRQRKTLIGRLLKTLSSGDFRQAISLVPKEMRKIFPQAGSWVRAKSWEYLLNTLNKSFSLREVVDYHSGDGTSKGSPMMGLVFDVWPKNMRALPRPRYSKVPAVEQDLFRKFILGGVIPQPSGEFTRTGHIHVIDEPIRGEDRPAEEVAGIYNIPVQTLAAWKAHFTRGTYKWTRRQMAEAQEALVNWPVPGDIVYLADTDAWINDSDDHPTKGYVLPGRVVDSYYGEWGWDIKIEQEFAGSIGSDMSMCHRTGRAAFEELKYYCFNNTEEDITFGERMSEDYMPSKRCYEIRPPGN